MYIEWWIYRTWKGIPTFQVKNNQSTLPLSILIPARNEADHIANTLEAIEANDAELDKIYVNLIDDHSDDGTAKIAMATHHSFHLEVTNLQDSPPPDETIAYKKWGLQNGITQSNNQHILMTDGDCQSNPLWINSYSQFIREKAPSIVTGPILYQQEESILDHFQSLDILGTIGVTAAGIRSQHYYLANGGNMYVNKNSFLDINGYEGNTQHASGDDVFLIQKMADQDTKSIHFIKSKDAVVYTTPENTWSSFIKQRIRWSTKTSSYKNKKLQVGLSIIFLTCLTIILNLFMLLVNWKLFLSILTFQVTVKGISDYLYLGRMARYFDKQKLMNFFLPSFLIHTFYIVCIGLASVFVKRYEWKGRDVK